MKKYTFIAFCFFLVSLFACGAENVPKVLTDKTTEKDTALIQKSIAAYRNSLEKIKTIELSYQVLYKKDDGKPTTGFRQTDQGNRIAGEYQWGRDFVRKVEYMASDIHFSKGNGGTEKHWYEKSVRCFDGQYCRVFNETTNSGTIKSGRAALEQGLTCPSFLTEAMPDGKSSSFPGAKSLLDFLELQKDNLVIAQQNDDTILLTLEYNDLKIPAPPFLISRIFNISLDRRHGYLPRKVEIFRSVWGVKHPSRIIRVDRFEKIASSDVWLPVLVEMERFALHAPAIYHETGRYKNGLTDAELEKMVGEKRYDECFKVAPELGFYSQSISGGQVIRRVDIKSIRMNTGLSSNKLTLQFPRGTQVYNFIQNQRYTIGGPDDPDISKVYVPLKPVSGLKVGDTVPNFEIENLLSEKAPKSFKRSDFEGKYLILYIRTWNQKDEQAEGKEQEFFLHLQKHYPRQIDSKPVAFLEVILADPKNRANAAAKIDKQAVPDRLCGIASRDAESLKGFGINCLKTFLVVNPQGKAAFIGGFDDLLRWKRWGDDYENHLPWISSIK